VTQHAAIVVQKLTHQQLAGIIAHLSKRGSNYKLIILVQLCVPEEGVPSAGNCSLIDHYEPEIISATDYYPFGMISRVSLDTTGKAYRYGFNGKENDNEVKGEGGQQDYGMRIYDTRVGRFLSVDPITRSYPWYTPY
jgi:RHS repeat-associated protein